MKAFVLTLVLLTTTALSQAHAASGGNGQGNQGCGLGNGGAADSGSCGNSGGLVTNLIEVSPTPINVLPSPVPVQVNPPSVNVTPSPVRVLAPITVNTPAGGAVTNAPTALGGQGGYAAGGNGGTSASSSSATAGSSTVTINQNSTGARRPAIAPDLGSLSNGPCTGSSGGLTIGLPGVSGGIQGSSTDRDCTLRYNISVVDQYDPDLAREMLNDLQGVKEARNRLKRPSDPRTDFVQSCQSNWTMACQQAIYGDR